MSDWLSRRPFWALEGLAIVTVIALGPVVAALLGEFHRWWPYIAVAGAGLVVSTSGGRRTRRDPKDRERRELHERWWEH